MKLFWRVDTSLGFARFVATVGNLSCSMTEGGAATIGRNVFVGEVAGDVVAVSGTAQECEAAILQHAARELSALETALRSLV